LRKFTTLLVLCGIALLAAASFANDYVAITDKFGYTGSMTVYNTLADAQSGLNARGGPYTVAQRDGTLYVVNGVPSVYSNYTQIMTTWYYTTQDNTNGYAKDDPNGNRYYSGWGNPNNTNTGFFQIADDGSSSVTSSTGTWTSSLYDTFVVNITGANAGAAQIARLWDAPTLGGAAEYTAGTFLNYNFTMTATGLAGAYDSGTGLILSQNHPTAVTGTVSGIFQNTSTQNPAANGYYVFNLTFNDTNWAYAQGDAALNGDFSSSYFGAQAVPEPGSMLALGSGLIGLIGFTIRRRRA
jgi:hypothetical protein